MTTRTTKQTVVCNEGFLGRGRGRGPKMQRVHHCRKSSPAVADGGEEVPNEKGLMVYGTN